MLQHLYHNIVLPSKSSTQCLLSIAGTLEHSPCSSDPSLASENPSHAHVLTFSTINSWIQRLGLGLVNAIHANSLDFKNILASMFFLMEKS